MFKILNSKQVSVIGFSNLDIIWDLGIGIWDFRPITVVVNCVNINGLLSTLTFPWTRLPCDCIDTVKMIEQSDTKNVTKIFAL